MPLLAKSLSVFIDNHAELEIEVIFVDDGSSDSSWQIIKNLHNKDGRYKGIKLDKNFGKSIALAKGFISASGNFIATLDADLQDDPNELPKLLSEINKGHDLVCAWRKVRKDSKKKEIASKIFNLLMQLIFRVPLHDINAGMKICSAKFINKIQLYRGFHRFLAVFAKRMGLRVSEVPIEHFPRIKGSSRYGNERIVETFFDMLILVFLRRHRAASRALSLIFSAMLAICIILLCFVPFQTLLPLLIFFIVLPLAAHYLDSQGRNKLNSCVPKDFLGL